MVGCGIRWGREESRAGYPGGRLLGRGGTVEAFRPHRGGRQPANDVGITVIISIIIKIKML